MTDLRKAAEMALEALDFDASTQPEPMWEKERKALQEALAQPEQEREWVGLPSDEEILEISKDVWGRSKLEYGRDDHRPFYIAFARAIEAKLKEKNT